MDEEARDVLPRVLEAIGFQRGILFGHSDGASIVTIYAGSDPGSSGARPGADGAAFLHRADGARRDPPRPRRLMPPALCGKNSSAGMPTSMARSSPGSGRGSIRTLRSGTSPKRLATSACRSWSCRAPTTNTARSGRSKRCRRSATARSRRSMLPGARHSPYRDAPERRSKRPPASSIGCLRDHHESDRPTDSGVAA